MVQVLALGDVDFMRGVVYFKTRHTAVENVGLLIIVFQRRRARPLFNIGPAMAKIPEQLSVG